MVLWGWCWSSGLLLGQTMGGGHTHTHTPHVLHLTCRMPIGGPPMPMPMPMPMPAAAGCKPTVPSPVSEPVLPLWLMPPALPPLPASPLRLLLLPL